MGLNWEPADQEGPLPVRVSRCAATCRDGEHAGSGVQGAAKTELRVLLVPHARPTRRAGNHPFTRGSGEPAFVLVAVLRSYVAGRVLERHVLRRRTGNAE